MTFVTTKIFPNVSRHSNSARLAAELANSLTAITLSEVFGSAGLAVATTTTKIKTVNSVNFTINGAFQTAVSGTDNLWTLGGTNSATVVKASSWQKYVLLWDSTGASNPVVYEGVQSPVSAASVTFTNISGMSNYAPLLTLLNLGYVVVGVATVATDSSHTFTPGTTALNGTGITTTFVNGMDPALLPILANQQNVTLGVGG